MEEIKKDFKDIFSSKELSDFVKKYKLMKEEVKGNPMIYANYYKDFDDFGVKVVHR
ncbi:MAG: hypothetical protein PHV08_03835 [Sulfurovaceae bacterium]|nr:hypothetical protein [Sulfurovaceae bacterium]